MAGKAKLFLVPTGLGSETLDDIIPNDVQKIASELRDFIVEDIRTARRYLRKIDRSFPIDDSTFHILNKKTSPSDLEGFLDAIKSGRSVGLMSEAGCPGVADPGAEIVSIAHKKGIEVVPLVGPSSILLTLMGSGFSGQQFTFHGYLPKDRKERIRKLKDFEADTRRTETTHLFMDTPFRNMNVLEDLLNELADNTMICIASNLTLFNASIKTMNVKDWRGNAYDLSKKPTMFAIGKEQ